MSVGTLPMKGDLGIQIIRRDAWVPEGLDAKRRLWTPKSGLGRIIRDCLEYLPTALAAELIDRVSRTVVLESSLAVLHIDRADPSRERWWNHGIVSEKVITTAGVGFLVDAWENVVEMEIMKYHGVGTTNTAEASSDTALAAESTTALNPDNTRATGSLADGGSANILVTVGTLTADSSIAAVEHGLFSQAATGGGTLWDRSIFTTVNLANGDSIQFTYSMTASAGG